jgi:hypothetical protein
MLIAVAISADRNVTKNKVGKILKHLRTHNTNSAHVECESKGDTSNKRSDRNPFQNHSDNT